MREKIVICGVPTGDPATTPPDAAPRPLLCDTNGILYSILADGSGFIVNLIGNDSTAISASSAPANVPTVGFNYIYDPGFGSWTQALARNNSIATFAADPAIGRNLSVVNAQYVWDAIGELFRRVEGLNTTQQVIPPPSAADQPMSAAIGLMAGFNDGLDPYLTRVKSLSSNIVGNPADHLAVAPLMSNGATDAPAADTAANINVGSSGSNYVHITGIQVTINAVAAIAAPILLTVTDDGGAGVIIFSKRYTAPAGSMINDNIPLSLLAFGGAQINVAAPGATNFATLSAQFVNNIGQDPQV
jgi:hypothetical protein